MLLHQFSGTRVVVVVVAVSGRLKNPLARRKHLHLLLTGNCFNRLPWCPNYKVDIDIMLLNRIESKLFILLMILQWLTSSLVQPESNSKHQ